MLPSLAHYLPYWASRTFPTNSGPFSVLILVDGTMVAGFRASGVDISSTDVAALNTTSATVGRALNLLPKDAFIQSEWRTGSNYDDVCKDLESRGMSGNPLLSELRRARAEWLRNDVGLIRGRLTYYVGQKAALGLLGSHAGKAPIWTRAIEAMTGKHRKDPYTINKEDLTKAGDELAELAGRFATEMRSTGQKLTSMTEEDLIGEVFSALNPYSARRYPAPHIVDSPEDLAASETRGPWAIFRPLTLREQLPLGDLTWEKEHFTIDDPPMLHRMMSLQKLPPATTPAFLSSLQFSSATPFRLVSTLVATDRQEIEEKLTKQRNQLQVHRAGIVEDINAEAAFRATTGTLRGLIERGERIFVSSLSVVVTGVDEDELELSTRLVKTAFTNLSAVGTTETQRQLYSFLGALPGNGFTAPRVYTLPTSNAAHLVPFFTPSLGDEEAQIVWHTKHESLRKVSFIGSRRTSKNAAVLGSTGKGKTFMINHIVQNCALADGGPVVILDVQGGTDLENGNRILCEVLGGRYIALNGAKDLSFNPFKPHSELITTENGVRGIDPNERAYLKRLVSLMAYPDLEKNPNKPLILNVADTCIMEAYDRTRASGQPPLLEDVVAVMGTYQTDDSEMLPIAAQMRRLLDRGWLRDDRREALLNRPTTFQPDTKLLVFDFHGIEKDQELATILFFSVANSIWSMLSKYPRGVAKFVVFDETWKLLTNQTASDLLKELYKTGRKWGAATWAITQSIDDFVNSPVASAIIDNSPNVLLLPHKAGAAAKTAACLKLPPAVAAMLEGIKTEKGRYSEILVLEDEAAAVLQYRATPFEVWLNTTDGKDIQMRKQLMADRQMSLMEAIRYLAEHYPKGADGGEKERAAS